MLYQFKRIIAASLTDLVEKMNDYGKDGWSSEYIEKADKSYTGPAQYQAILYLQTPDSEES